MCRTILMDVRQLHHTAKDEKKREERYEPSMKLRIRHPQSAHSRHDSSTPALSLQPFRALLPESLDNPPPSAQNLRVGRSNDKQKQ